MALISTAVGILEIYLNNERKCKVQFWEGAKKRWCIRSVLLE